MVTIEELTQFVVMSIILNGILLTYEFWRFVCWAKREWWPKPEAKQTAEPNTYGGIDRSNNPWWEPIDQESLHNVVVENGSLKKNTHQHQDTEHHDP